MQVRQVDVSESDKVSAWVFFETLMRYYDMSEWKALDAFARNGQLTAGAYASKVARLDMWELNSEHVSQLHAVQQTVQGHSEVRIGDSYQFAKESSPIYDMVVIDTPQGLHKDSTGAIHVEHFDFFELTLQHLLRRAGGLVVLYVNKEPYDRSEFGSHGYDEYDEYDFNRWMKARWDYYIGDMPGKVKEETALATYRKAVKELGWSLLQAISVPCFSDVPGKEPYAFRLGLELRR